MGTLFCGNISLQFTEKAVKIRTRKKFVPHGKLSPLPISLS